MIIWFTGLSGSGKSVYADYLRKEYGFIVLDGDELRKTLNSDLGFSDKDKTENGRRMIELCKLLNEYNVCVPTIVGQEWGRKWVTEELKEYKLYWIWVKCSIETCVKRDPKGIYKKNPPNLAGVSYKWEDPKKYDLCLDTEKNSIQENCEKIYHFLKR